MNKLLPIVNIRSRQNCLEAIKRAVMVTREASVNKVVLIKSSPQAGRSQLLHDSRQIVAKERNVPDPSRLPDVSINRTTTRTSFREKVCRVCHSPQNAAWPEIVSRIHKASIPILYFHNLDTSDAALMEFEKLWQQLDEASIRHEGFAITLVISIESGRLSRLKQPVKAVKPLKDRFRKEAIVANLELPSEQDLMLAILPTWSPHLAQLDFPTVQELRKRRAKRMESGLGINSYSDLFTSKEYALAKFIFSATGGWWSSLKELLSLANARAEESGEPITIETLKQVNRSSLDT